MPRVGNRRFPYTQLGEKNASRYSRESGQPVVNTSNTNMQNNRPNMPSPGGVGMRSGVGQNRFGQRPRGMQGPRGMQRPGLQRSPGMDRRGGSRVMRNPGLSRRMGSGNRPGVGMQRRRPGLNKTY